MNISQDFDEQVWSSRLGKRRDNFKLMCEHAARRTKDFGCNIIETGTSRIKDNWEGDGQSTLIFDWLASRTGAEVTSIDLVKENVDVARTQTKFVNYYVGDSIQTLNSMDSSYLANVGLLYLDSFDWSEQLNFESAYHHMGELAAVWRALPNGCMVVVDDRHGHLKGKHWMVETFMMVLKYEPVFKNYQIGWVK